VTGDVDGARRDWEDGYRRLLEASRDPRRAEALDRQLEAVTGELRRRVGSTFTLAELAAAYAGADRWTYEAVAEHAPSPGWPRDAAVVGDAAFHLYARGAADYEP
jgi:hypothetical protein